MCSEHSTHMLRWMSNVSKRKGMTRKRENEWTSMALVTFSPANVYLQKVRFRLIILNHFHVAPIKSLLLLLRTQKRVSPEYAKGLKIIFLSVCFPDDCRTKYTPPERFTTSVYVNCSTQCGSRSSSSGCSHLKGNIATTTRWLRCCRQQNMCPNTDQSEARRTCVIMKFTWNVVLASWQSLFAKFNVFSLSNRVDGNRKKKVQPSSLHGNSNWGKFSMKKIPFSRKAH